MADVRDRKPANEDEIYFMQAALLRSRAQFKALTGRLPISLRSDRHTYNRHMDFMNVQVRLFYRGHETSTNPLLPRHLPWPEGISYADYDPFWNYHALPDTDPKGLQYWENLGGALQLMKLQANRETKNSSETADSLETEDGTEVEDVETEDDLEKKDDLEAEDDPGEASRSEVRAGLTDEVSSACLKMFNFVAGHTVNACELKNLLDGTFIGMYKHWLLKLAADSYETSLAASEGTPMGWEEWCSKEAPYKFKEYLKEEVNQDRLIDEKVTAQIRECPTISYGEAVAVRKMLAKASEQDVTATSQPTTPPEVKVHSSTLNADEKLITDDAETQAGSQSSTMDVCQVRQGLAGTNQHTVTTTEHHTIPPDVQEDFHTLEADCILSSDDAEVQVEPQSSAMDVSHGFDFAWLDREEVDKTGGEEDVSYACDVDAYGYSYDTDEADGPI